MTWPRLGVLALVGVVLCGVLYAALCAYMALTLARPDRHPFTRTPASFGLPVNDVSFPSRVDGLTLRGWLLEPATPSRARPVVLVHGKGGDRQSGPGEGALGVGAALAADGYRVLAFDLRGSGESAGERFTLGAQEIRDVGGAIDFLTAQGLAPEGVYLVGFSMGAATAMLSAEGEDTVRAVVEDSGYADLGELLEVQVPRASGLPSFFTPGVVVAVRALLGVDLDEIRPIDGLPRLAAAGVPLLVIHGLDDTYVPPSHGVRLAAAYGPKAQTYFVPGAGHVEGRQVDPQAYDARLRDFLAAVP
jgi:pimeloyl-ACP methyl ester carboxylesterase